MTASTAAFHPDGVNLTKSVAGLDLQREVERYSGSGFAAKRTAIHARYAACSTADRSDVHTQNQWRNLVEARFSGSERTKHQERPGIR